MQPRSAVFLRVFLNTFHPGPPQTLLKVLPQELANETMRAEVTSKNPSLGLTWFKQLIDRTHYSWLAPVVEKIPKGLHSAMIAALSEVQSKGLTRILKVSAFPGALPQVAKDLLLKHLYLQWKPEGIPLDYIPTTSMSELLTFSKEELVELIDFLAIYDLSEAIKQVVDTKKLKMVYLCLSGKKQQFLRTCLQKKDKIAAPKFEIDKWDGKQETLDYVMHRRGLLRLGKALSGQGQQFMWHLKHTLDTGRGKILTQYYEDHGVPEITPLLIQQVHSVIKFLKPKSSL